MLIVKFNRIIYDNKDLVFFHLFVLYLQRRRKNVYTPKIDFHHDPTNFFSSRLLCQHSSSALTTITFAILLTFMTLISTCLRRYVEG